MNLKLIRFLADNGKPLRITLEPGEWGHVLSREGTDETVGLEGIDPLPDIKRGLTHYPREVWINGERMRTQPRPMLGEVRLLQPTQRDMTCDRNRPLVLEGPWKRLLHNAYVAGLWSRVQRQPPGDNPTAVHLADDQGGDGDYRLLARVAITPHMEVEADELDMLLEERDGRMRSRMVPDGELMERIRQREQEMIRRTLEHPDVPEPYTGRVHSCPLNSDAFTPAPIRVLGTPVVIDRTDGSLDNGQFNSIVEALNRTGSGYVPVNEESSWVDNLEVPGAAQDTLRVGAAAFTCAPPDTERPERISLRVEFSDGREPLEVPALFVIRGDDTHNLDVRVVPGAIEPGDLTDIMLRTAWGSLENDGLEMEQMWERLHSLSTHLLGETNAAILRDLQHAADTFRSLVPLPEGPLEATGRNGRITVRLNPGA